MKLVTIHKRISKSHWLEQDLESMLNMWLQLRASVLNLQPGSLRTLFLSTFARLASNAGLMHSFITNQSPDRRELLRKTLDNDETFKALTASLPVAKQVRISFLLGQHLR